MRFEKTKIEYLGVIISHNKAEMDPVKIARVADWLTPSNKKEVQSFISFVNFYRHFIPEFSHHVRALFDPTMKDVRFIWGMAPISLLQPKGRALSRSEASVRGSPGTLIPDILAVKPKASQSTDSMICGP
jgi:hypothetical protein